MTKQLWLCKRRGKDQTRHVFHTPCLLSCNTLNCLLTISCMTIFIWSMSHTHIQNCELNLFSTLENTLRKRFHFHVLCLWELIKYKRKNLAERELGCRSVTLPLQELLFPSLSKVRKLYLESFCIELIPVFQNFSNSELKTYNSFKFLL